ncbi:hypothetical protein OG943_48030 [Amycolatopsis sp. NBC_00345]|uniref:hypothetical protein n=1 Tax=Amycolatopsis sp. NBC_00345 TaxID=2975955 RepID=UPI002E273CF9
MALFGRNRKRRDGGYQDNAALTGFGGYEPSDAPATGYTGITRESSVAEPVSGADFGSVPPPVSPGTEPVTKAGPQRIRPPAKPGRKRRGSRVVWAVIVVLGMGAAGGLNVFGTGRHHSPTTPSTSRPPVSSAPEPRVVVPAVVPGWQSVASRDGSYAYDVPPSWTPEPGTVHGWDKTATAPGITLSTSAFVGEGFCPGASDSRRGGAGVTTEPTGDADQAVRKAVDDLAVSAYGPGSGRTPGPGEDTTVQLGKVQRPARLVFADVVPNDAAPNNTDPNNTAPCASKHVLVGAIAFSGQTASAVLVAYADQDAPGAASRDDLTRLLRSYRGVPASDRSTSTPATR